MLFDAKGTELLAIQVRVQQLTKTHSRLRVTFVPEYSLCSLEVTISFVVPLGFINSNLAESIHPLLVPWTGNTTVKIFWFVHLESLVQFSVLHNLSKK